MTKHDVATISAGAGTRQISPIDPKSLRVQETGGQGGQDYKTVVVRWTPEGLTPNDLVDHPEIWELVQKLPRTALNANDKLEIRMKGRTVFAAVNYVDGPRVVLYDIRNVSRPENPLALPGNETFETRPLNGQYTYFRKADGVQMTAGLFPTADAAWAACMREQYPARVA